MPKCFNQAWIKETPFEDKDMKLEYIGDMEQYIDWCEPARVIVDATIKNWVDSYD